VPHPVERCLPAFRHRQPDSTPFGEWVPGDSPRDYIHSTAEQLLEFGLEPSKIQKCSAGAKGNQEVDVAQRSLLAAGDWAEQPHSFCTVGFSGSNDLPAKSCQIVPESHISKLVAPGAVCSTP
jgi:hypothetical protein